MPKPQKKVNKKSGKKVQRGPVDLNESMSSGQSEYDDGSKAKFTEMVEGKIRNAQAQLFEDDFVGYSQGSFAGLATGSAFEAPKAPESDELFKKLSKILNEFEAQPPSGNKMKDNFGRLYQLLILFLKMKSSCRKEDYASHPVLGLLARMETLRPFIRDLDSEIKRTDTALPEDSEKGSSDEDPVKTRANPITSDMFKNRGIPKLRSIKKKTVTPRVKQKLRFRKANTVMKSRGMSKKAVFDRVYGGEATGIRVGINRNVNL